MARDVVCDGKHKRTCLVIFDSGRRTVGHDIDSEAIGAPEVPRIAADDGAVLRQGEAGIVEIKGPNVFA